MTDDARARAAEAAGLPPQLADRLRGDDEDALHADARDFARALRAAPVADNATPIERMSRGYGAGTNGVTA
jgi:hypothetical protein